MLPDLPQRLGIHPSLQPLWLQLTPEQQAAAALVWLAQAGHGYDLGRPSNRAIAIRWWSEFLPARVQIAAMTSVSLAEFCSVLAARLRGQLGAKGEAGITQRALWQEIIALPDDVQQVILDVLAAQAIALVTLVRADLDLKKHPQQEHSLGQEAEPVKPRHDASQPSLFDVCAPAGD